jgi:hypothetical protein
LVLRNDILVKQSLLQYTLYDEAAQALRNVTGLGFREVLAFEQVLARALGIWGLYLMAEALGLSMGPALLVAAICSLGATIAGPAVLSIEYEPTPRAFAVPWAWRLAAGISAPASPPPARLRTMPPRRFRSWDSRHCWRCRRSPRISHRFRNKFSACARRTSGSLPGRPR